jgi:hypothetical protein
MQRGTAHLQVRRHVPVCLAHHALRGHLGVELHALGAGPVIQLGSARQVLGQGAGLRQESRGRLMSCHAVSAGCGGHVMSCRAL